MAKPVVLDLETQYSFSEKGKDPRKLKVSVVGIYDYDDCSFKGSLRNSKVIALKT